jgi:hypothetical protein
MTKSPVVDGLTVIERMALESLSIQLFRDDRGDRPNDSWATLTTQDRDFYRMKAHFIATGREPPDWNK